MKFLEPLYHFVAVLLNGIHDGLTHVPLLDGDSISWVLAIILLTVSMRLVLFPVFVKQIRNQRAMQTLQPKMKELQAKYKNDKEKLNQEMMALWKENGANPIAGCLPLLLQIPIFIALFHTLREIKPTACTADSYHAAGGLCYNAVPGFSAANLASAANAKIFGAPIAASFTSSAHYIAELGGNQTATRIVCIVMTILMGASTFITQRQLMAQNSSSGGSTQMAQQQKIMLYVFPLVFLFYGFRFPVGVLLYWLTTNVWSMAQQRVVIARMNAPAAPDVATPPPAGPVVGAKPKAPLKPAPSSGITLPPGGAIPATTPPRPSNQRGPANNRSKNKKKGKR